MVKRAAFLMSATGRVALGTLLYTATRIVCRMEIHGLHNVRQDAVSYLAISHKRDLDTMGPVFPVVRARGWQALIHDVRFAMRGDAFTPHFLARVVPRPGWFSWLLWPISVGPLLRSIGLYPLQNLRIWPAEEWIREHLRAEGDAVLSEALSAEFIHYLSAQLEMSPKNLEQQSLSSLLNWKYHVPMQVYWGSELFIGGARRHAEQRVIAQARKELDDVAAWMRAGGSLYSSPEGTLSADGTVSRITSGFHRMLRAAPEGTSVIPIAIIYDFMTTRRLSMFVEVVTPIADVGKLPRVQLDRELQTAWRRNMRFTCTQLASGILRRTAEAEGNSLTLDSLTEGLVAQANTLVSEGRLVDDRLLQPRRAEKLAKSYLHYAERHHLVRRLHGNRWIILDLEQAIDVRPGDVGYPVAPFTYACNELRDMLSVGDQGTEQQDQAPEKPENEIAG